MSGIENLPHRQIRKGMKWKLIFEALQNEETGLEGDDIERNYWLSSRYWFSSLLWFYRDVESNLAIL